MLSEIGRDSFVEHTLVKFILIVARLASSS